MSTVSFQLVSDLHLDFRDKVNPFYRIPEWKIFLQRRVIAPNVESERPSDVLIVAGDLCEASNDTWRESLCMLADYYEFVLLVAGNHEHYNTRNKIIRDKAASLPGNVHFLRRKEINVGGVIVAGSTLWFEDDYNPDLKAKLSDFKYIPDFETWLSNEHLADVDFFETSNADVFISHHLPHENSVSPRYRYDELNCFFVKDMTYAVQHQAPKVWVHGHTHSSCDYMLANTRVICNPLGYPAELKREYPLCQFEVECRPDPETETIEELMEVVA
jgi:calcineurin-like phosphoesterase family protein